MNVLTAFLLALTFWGWEAAAATVVVGIVFAATTLWFLRDQISPAEAVELAAVTP